MERKKQKRETEFEKDLEIRNEGRKRDPGGILDVPAESAEIKFNTGGFNIDNVDISGNERDTTKVLDKKLLLMVIRYTKILKLVMKLPIVTV